MTASVYFKAPGVKVFEGECLEVLRKLPDNSIDSFVTDPPYGLSNTDPKHVAETIVKWASGDREYTPAGKGFMGKAWDAFVPPPAVWDEALRVLKPGGHLLVFAGSRTFDLMTLSIRLSGFDIRDSIAWLYGSGFPKSMSVAKAIASGGGRPEDIRRMQMGDKYTPSGRGRVNYDHGGGSAMNGKPDVDVDLPDEAAKWQGWGTALKPAFEPIVVARKPLGGEKNIVKIVERELYDRSEVEEIMWTTRPASGAARRSRTPRSGSTGQRQTAATSAATASVSETLNTEPATAMPIAMPDAGGAQQTRNEPEQRTAETSDASASPSSTRTEDSASAAGNEKKHSSRSTTSTEAAPSTVKLFTARSTRNSDASDTPVVTESFAGIATGLTGSQGHVRIDRLSDGTFLWPDGLPESVSIGSTVAANVLAHGTGALNIDATRVGMSEADRAAARVPKSEWSQSGTTGATARRTGDTFEPAQGGRWPANVILDESQAAELDRQAPNTGGSGKASGPSLTGKTDGTVAYGARNGTDETLFYGDTGGASRFFYVAKAPKKERPTADGVSHPTVKPLTLMRQLVKLVTPPGGLVLDPFAGSGTTTEAALLEGFKTLAIEMTQEYLPLIQQRIERVQKEEDE